MQARRSEDHTKRFMMRIKLKVHAMHVKNNVSQKVKKDLEVKIEISFET